MSLRIMLVIVGLLAAACSPRYADVLRRLDAEPSCCESMAAFPYHQLSFGHREELALTSSSPAYRFRWGKSYFAAFALPPFEGPYRILIDSYVAGDGAGRQHVLLPFVLVLDGRYERTRSFDENLFELRTAGLAGSRGVPRKLSGTIEVQEEDREDRYLIILAKEELTRASISLSSAEGKDNDSIRALPVGKLLIRLERIAP